MPLSLPLRLYQPDSERLKQDGVILKVVVLFWFFGAFFFFKFVLYNKEIEA